MTHPLFDKHRDTLDRAVQAIGERTYWSAYPEVPSGKVYGETAKADGQAAFEARLSKTFDLDQPGKPGAVGDETSPYGMELGVRYPEVDLNELVDAAEAATVEWKQASVEARTGVCLEILHRLNQRSFELANAVMHTTGQAFMMAFQAGGPHAQDRGLEAVAYAYQAMTQTPERVTWEKRVSKTDTVTLHKRYRIVPRGIAAVVGCSTFPTWNGYPGLFASLATGNAVVVKPHPGAILPLAITVEIAREVIREVGFDANLVTLAGDSADAPLTKELVTHEKIGIVDYTGSTDFGDWIEANATQAIVFTEKAGVNSLVIDSAEDMKAMTGNIAFTVCLYSGQMCTATQNIFVPRDGAIVGGEKKTFDEVSGGIVKAIDWFLSDENRAVEVLGAIQNPRTAQHINDALRDGGTVQRDSSAIAHPLFKDARVHSPIVITCDASDEHLYMREMFGPIVYIVATDDTAQSIELAARCAKEIGSITAALYSTDDSVIERMELATAEAGVPLSVNLTGHIYVNQSAAFSDFHVSGVNPSGNATLCDNAFIAGRFHVVQSRSMAAVPAAV